MSSISSVSVLVDTAELSPKGRHKLSPLQVQAQAQTQAALYGTFAKGDGPASDDLKALKTAIEQGNFANTVAAVSRLQRDSQSVAVSAQRK